MNPLTLKLESGAILYDADLFSVTGQLPTSDWFDPGWWRSQGLVDAEERGRGTALVLTTPVGRTVLRQYLRGGWAARLAHSRYLFHGYRHSRPFREFSVLERIARLDLPAPRPVAGYCRRAGVTYTGALMTVEIENTTTIERVLGTMDGAAWQAVGACLRRFHDAGLVHADLTVRNILIQEGGGIFLVDFDRARFSPGARRAFRGNLQRLKRSLRKAFIENDIETDHSAWKHLLKGYES